MACAVHVIEPENNKVLEVPGPVKAGDGRWPRRPTGRSTRSPPSSPTGSHLLALVVLIFTGLLHPRPVLRGRSRTVRYVHLFVVFFLVGPASSASTGRFFGARLRRRGRGRRGSATATSSARRRTNRGTIWRRSSTTSSCGRPTPCTAKYNPLQKLAYGALLFAVILDAFTGLAMWHVTQPYFEPITYVAGRHPGDPPDALHGHVDVHRDHRGARLHRRHRGALGAAADVLLEGRSGRCAWSASTCATGGCWSGGQAEAAEETTRGGGRQEWLSRPRPTRE